MRYKVIDESVSGHCCFEASVIDTTKERKGVTDLLCECFELSNAHLICNLLNDFEIRKVNNEIS